MLEGDGGVPMLTLLQFPLHPPNFRKTRPALATGLGDAGEIIRLIIAPFYLESESSQTRLKHE